MYTVAYKGRTEHLATKFVIRVKKTVDPSQPQDGSPAALPSENLLCAPVYDGLRSKCVSDYVANFSENNCEFPCSAFPAFWLSGICENLYTEITLRQGRLERSRHRVEQNSFGISTVTSLHLALVLCTPLN